ncbi:FEKKY domain-containing protein [Polaribacter aquimarinus]|uniref:Uncharacterized protein n=1 Tax=Polaribacter aquimarinus TaxID=2100726 RepID=A0A2U2J6S5_9FLAO|nr:hypothetical protein [Polaribacter aquimarinus]PWG04045.1 hypothetical protein DIS07_14740 [Polaribacter aquimarinus]
MRRKRKLKIGIGILIVGVILWQFGFLTRFNYLTAKIDIWRDSPRIASYGLPSYPCGVPCIGLKEKYGFHESNIGCVVTSPQIRGINAYNAEIEKYLNKRNGKDWREKYQAEMDSLIKNKMLE